MSLSESMQIISRTDQITAAMRLATEWLRRRADDLQCDLLDGEVNQLAALADDVECRAGLMANQFLTIAERFKRTDGTT